MRIFIDRGGTFTDAIGITPDGPRVVKVLSNEDAPLAAVRALLQLPKGAALPPCDVRMGTTLATNALLERKGAPTALIITQGFGDLLLLGDQTRPDLFALHIERPAPLYEEVLELRARSAPDGTILEAPDKADTRAALRALRARGVESLAISLLHAHRNGELERRIGNWARAEGFAHVVLSHEVACEIGLLARTETTVTDAYVTPMLRRYATELTRMLPGSSVQLMQSSGTLCAAHALRGRDALLSGPAGGAVAVARIAEQLELPAAIGFDMGGTSTDVLRYTRAHGRPGTLERVYELRVPRRGGARVRAPAVDIHTIAAGGGSVCRLDGARLTVGPDSAGASPGPLCYGRSREPGQAAQLALTDINLALGRISPERFAFALDASAVQRALQAIASQLGQTPELIAQGFFDVATEHMADAIRAVSIARGHDVREHALIAFGGASGQHACALARRLGIRRIVFHPYAGVLSAWGMGGAARSAHAERDAQRAPLSALLEPALQGVFDALEAQALLELQAAAIAGETTQPVFVRRADLRYRGTEAALTLELDATLADEGAIRAAFEREHMTVFGYMRHGHPLEVAALRVEAVLPAPAAPPTPVTQAHAPRDARTARLWSPEQARFIDAPVFDRERLPRGQRLRGPLVVLEAIGTIVVDAGFELTQTDDGCVLLDDVAPATKREPRPAHEALASDPVQLEVMSNRFMSIAEQMGIVLGRTALSTNIRERLDYSCAIFDPQAGLVANAPHIPVHLGAMSESVRAVCALHPQMAAGDVFCTNDPALGGSHLPDITVVTPVFDASGALSFFTASRGHHADVGGITAGSMPPSSTRLEEEGVVFSGLRIAHAGGFDEDAVRAVLCGGPHPARDPEQNLADLRAQIAANRRGELLLRELAEERGLPFVHAYMQHVQRDAEARVRAAIAALPLGEHRFEDVMDDGTRICVSVGRVAEPPTAREHPRGAALVIDFNGSSAEVASNLNAPRAVTVAAVIYVLRLLVEAPIPLNGGCLAPVELIIPERSVLCPSRGAAVAAGNVETSQRIVDVLLAALGKLAACQGTMNNLTFGDASFGYYETISGGAGAGPTHAGASGVHTHMTNTRITDPEVLEARFPVRLLRFSLRRATGGAGRFAGGDGVVRELMALAPLEASLLSDRRTSTPFGLAGGEPGACGRNTLNGRVLAGRAQLTLQAGDSLCIETPGGGGFGAR
jgi:5-oxoprolinase (ATP-hydrolysing)